MRYEDGAGDIVVTLTGDINESSRKPLRMVFQAKLLFKWFQPPYPKILSCYLRACAQCARSNKVQAL